MLLKIANGRKLSSARLASDRFSGLLYPGSQSDWSNALGDDSTELPPMLDYATPRRVKDEAELDWRVQKMIADGAGPTEIRPYFRRDREVIQYFCEVIGRLRGMDALTGRCVDCGVEAHRLAIQLGWRIEMRVRNFSISLSRRSHGPAIVTWHSICKSCDAKWSRRLRWDNLRRWAILVVGIWVWLTLPVIFGEFVGTGDGDLNQEVLRSIFYFVMFVETAKGDIHLCALGVRKGGCHL